MHPPLCRYFTCDYYVLAIDARMPALLSKYEENIKALG